MRPDRVLLSEAAARLLKEWSNAAAPFETGGILLGILGDGHPWIISAIEIRSAAPRHYAYELPAGVTRDLVREARRSDKRIGYLGDWHSHPADLRASLTDLQTYRRILRAAIFQREQRPLLVVVRRSDLEWNIDVLTRASWHWRTVPIQFAITGPPPADHGRSILPS